MFPKLIVSNLEKLYKLQLTIGKNCLPLDSIYGSSISMIGFLDYNSLPCFYINGSLALSCLSLVGFSSICYMLRCSLTKNK